MLALTPGVGDIDIAVASELLEAGAHGIGTASSRASARTLIASTSRFYAMDEKIAMGDGRFDQRQADARRSPIMRATRVLIDMDALAKQSGSIINAVMLGAIAGSRAPADHGRAVRGRDPRRRQGGRGQSARLPRRLRGRARQGRAAASRPSARRGAAADSGRARSSKSRTRIPGRAQDIVLEGVRRLVPYQSVAYARLYLDRLAPIVEADDQAGLHGALLREVARHLAVRMSYEDVVRVAQAKIAPARMQRIAREELRVKDEPYSVHDFLKPGIEELTQLLPPSLARPILRLAERKGWLGRVYFGMEIKTTSIFGYLRFLLLAKMRRIRALRHPLREGAGADRSPGSRLIVEAAQRAPDLALEIAECARLIKGYGDTHARGLANYRAIEARVIRPALAGAMPLGRAADAVAQRPHRGA